MSFDLPNAAQAESFSGVSTALGGINSLVYRPSISSHQVANMVSPEKNIECRVMVIQLLNTFQTKRDLIHSVLVADETGCIKLNLFNETGSCMRRGDILYINGAYTSVFKGEIILYQGTNSIVRRVDRHCLRVNLEYNASTMYLAHHPC